jgi:hypothetical protein
MYVEVGEWLYGASGALLSRAGGDLAEKDCLIVVTMLSQACLKRIKKCCMVCDEGAW